MTMPRFWSPEEASRWHKLYTEGIAEGLSEWDASKRAEDDYEESQRRARQEQLEAEQRLAAEKAAYERSWPGLGNKIGGHAVGTLVVGAIIAIWSLRWGCIIGGGVFLAASYDSINEWRKLRGASSPIIPSKAVRLLGIIGVLVWAYWMYADSRSGDDIPYGLTGFAVYLYDDRKAPNGDWYVGTIECSYLGRKDGLSRARVLARREAINLGFDTAHSRYYSICTQTKDNGCITKVR